MNIWNQLSRPQQLLLALGVPLVAIAALVVSRRQQAAPEPEPDVTAEPPVGVLPGYVPTTDAIGTGTLADWTTNFTAALGDLSQQIAELETSPSTTPPATPSPGNPLAPTLAGAQLGKRQTTSRNVQPEGRGFPGETMSEISRRVYGDRGYWNYVRYFNPRAWPGSPDKAVPAGTVIYY